MNGKEWQEIERLRQQLTTDEQRKRAEEEQQRLEQQKRDDLERRNREKLRLEDERRREQVRRQQEQEVLKEQTFHKRLVMSATQQIVRVFSDLRDHVDYIRNAPMKQVNQALDLDGQYPSGYTELKWGNKFEPTKQEQRWLNEYYKPGLFWQVFSSAPDSILIEDFYTMTSNINASNTNLNGGQFQFATEDVNSNPSRLVQPIGNILYNITLHNTNHSYRTATKGVDYWREPPPPPPPAPKPPRPSREKRRRSNESSSNSSWQRGDGIPGCTCGCASSM